MRSGCRIESSITMRSVTNGSGTKEESRNAARKTPGPPSAGNVAFTQPLAAGHFNACKLPSSLVRSPKPALPLLVFARFFAQIRPEFFHHRRRRVPSYLRHPHRRHTSKTARTDSELALPLRLYRGRRQQPALFPALRTTSPAARPETPTKQQYISEFVWKARPGSPQPRIALLFLIQMHASKKRVKTCVSLLIASGPRMQVFSA